MRRLTAALKPAGPLGLLLLLPLLLGGCGTVPPCCPPDAGRTEGPLQVAVSVPPQAYFVRRIGGPHVQVEVMIPPGYSHVDYPLTPRKMAALSNADLYVKVGHPGFEFEARQIDPFLAGLPAVRVVDMSQGMQFLDTASAEGNGHREIHDDFGEAHGDGHDHGGSDPHVWVAPATVAVAAVNIAAGLAAADPDHAGEYRANLRRFLADIRDLDREIRARLGAAPGTGGRAFLVYHPTWGYFADQYGLTQIAIESEGREPSAARLISLIERARREGVRVIFVQEGFPRKSAQVIAEAVGGRVVTADPQRYDWLANLREVSAEMSRALPHGRPENG